MSLAQRVRALVRRPSILGMVALGVALAVVWGVMLFSANQPQTLDAKAVAVESQLLLPGGDGESLVNAAGPQADLMRQVVREQLASGRSEQQVIAYMERNYGEGILAKPPFNGFTLLIWLVPASVFALGVAAVVMAAREWHAPGVASAQGVRTARGGRDHSPVRVQARATARRGTALAADDGGSASAQMSADERARWQAMLTRELAAEEGLPPHTQTPGKGGA